MKTKNFVQRAWSWFNKRLNAVWFEDCKIFNPGKKKPGRKEETEFQQEEERRHSPPSTRSSLTSKEEDEDMDVSEESDRSCRPTQDELDLSVIPDGYELVKVLKHGDPTLILLCQKLATQEEVVLKMAPTFDEDTLTHEAFICEKLMMLNVDNDNIIKYNGSIVHQDILCLEFEALDMNLRDYITHHGIGNIKLSDIRMVIHQLAEALIELKKHSLIHGDVRMEHIMFVDVVNQPLKVKLIDFSLAEHSKSSFLGSTQEPVAHKAPEVVLQLPLSEAIDVWALGCVISEMIDGIQFYHSSSDYEMLKSLVEFLGPPPQHLVSASFCPHKYFKRNGALWVLKSPEEMCEEDSDRERLTVDTHRKPGYMENCLKELASRRDYNLFGSEFEECIDLLTAMLKWDAKDRITPEGILNHPFITESYSEESEFSNEDSEDFNPFKEETDVPVTPKGYKCVRVLGSGSFGVVMLCQKPGTDDYVALKTSRGNLSSNLEREVWLHEGLRSYNLEDQGIIKYHGHLLENSRFFLEFEVLDISMETYLNTCKRIRLEDIRTVVQQLAVALKSLQSLHMVHADIKPNNIMLVDHINQPFKVKLIDFGLARYSSSIRQGAELQPFAHRAPEVILQLPLSEAIDVWALGCVMAHMILGDWLFNSRFEYEMLKLIVDLLGPPPQHLVNAALFPARYFDRDGDLWVLKSPKEVFDEGVLPPMFSRTLDDLKERCFHEEEEEEDSAACLDLLMSMLTWDAKDRITPEGILNHPFITKSYREERQFSNKDSDSYAFKGGRYDEKKEVSSEESKPPKGSATSVETVGVLSHPKPPRDQTQPQNLDRSMKKTKKKKSHLQHAWSWFTKKINSFGFKICAQVVSTKDTRD